MKTPIQRTMMTLFFCFAFVSGFAQVKVYKNNSSYSGDVICNLKGDKVYQGNSSYSGDVLCHVADNKVYRGNSSYSGDILYTIRNGKVYSGFQEMWFSPFGKAKSTKRIRAIRVTLLPTRKATKSTRTIPTIQATSISIFLATLPSNSLWPFGMW